MPQVEMFNLYYFIYIAIGLSLTVLAIHHLKDKSDKYRFWFIYGLILFNFAIHFLKVLIYPYTLVDEIWTKVSFENICAVSVLLFPIFYFVKNKTVKDYMVMVGMASGILTFIAPLDAMSTIFNGTIDIGSRPAFMLENIRFYTAHYLLFLAPFLMMHYNMHEISIHRVLRAPLMLMLILFIIFLNELLITALGWVPKEHLFNPEKRNPSFIFGPRTYFSGAAMIAGAFVPSFFRLVHPVYEFTFYVPVVWLIIPVMIYGTMIALVFCYIYDRDETKLLFRKLFDRRYRDSKESQNI